MAAVRLAAFRVRNSDTWCNRFFPNFTILHAPSAVQLYTASSWKWLLLYAAVFFVETGHPLLLAASAIPSVGRVHICSFVLFFFFARLWFLGLAHFCCWLHPCLPACLPAVGSFLPVLAYFLAGCNFQARSGASLLCGRRKKRARTPLYLWVWHVFSMCDCCLAAG
jgi:hypothetical protein